MRQRGISYDDCRLSILPNFIAGTVHALESYGAVPKYLVPDNLKTAITKHTKDELVINSAYQDLENF